MNIYQTAFDKAGILKEFDLQKEIAAFQGQIAYEIFKARKPNDQSSSDVEYLDLAHEKFTFIDDSDWIAAIENERTVLSAQPETKPAENQTLAEAPIPEAA